MVVLRPGKRCAAEEATIDWAGAELSQRITRQR
jgi:hypothetical protein